MDKSQPSGRAFFIPSIVPGVTPENQEAVYAGFAAWCECKTPKMNERIYSIDFVHDGVEWAATAGEHLQGTKRETVRRKGKKVVRKVGKWDQAIVLAIFSGPLCYMVVTDHKIAGNVGSHWANPFLAGVPKSITYFSGE